MKWTLLDSGPISGEKAMDLDERALEYMELAVEKTPRLHLFQWREPTVSFGYLMNEAAVKKWTLHQGHFPMVKRPTGGGAVFHNTADLSLSILWPRGSMILPDHPRAAYQEIHEILKVSMEDAFGPDDITLLSAPASGCSTDDEMTVDSQGRFSVCYEQPVCNDVMRNGKKIIGGALRLKRYSILYQGNIRLHQSDLVSRLKRQIEVDIRQALGARFTDMYQGLGTSVN